MSYPREPKKIREAVNDERLLHVLLKNIRTLAEKGLRREPVVNRRARCSIGGHSSKAVLCEHSAAISSAAAAAFKERNSKSIWDEKPNWGPPRKRRLIFPRIPSPSPAAASFPYTRSRILLTDLACH
jgi:hypothetical protein